ncbi:MAG TPA: hypothetical protein VEM13_00370 [Gemmatimonadales bacterium]|nr:hypothetical protein [Gemmatimonadales bacterium]
MGRAATLALVGFAACWLAAGPGGVTVQALLACRHHPVHHSHTGHHRAPTGGAGGGACFCDEMTGGVDLAVSPAVPTPLPAEFVIGAPLAVASSPSLFPLPSSPSFPPVSPPPNVLA